MDKRQLHGLNTFITKKTSGAYKVVKKDFTPTSLAPILTDINPTTSEKCLADITYPS